jgi:hypothetical protein
MTQIQHIRMFLHNMIPIEKEDAYIKNHLGLSFLAIDGNFTISSVIHRTVRDDIFLTRVHSMGKVGLH